MPPRAGFAFGPFELDTHAKRLLRDGVDLLIPSRYFDLLHALVSRGGQVLTKEELLKAGWDDVAVSDNSLNQAISRLRGVLDEKNPGRYIETVSRRGYRFRAAVTPIAEGAEDFDLDAILTPDRRWIDGRAALESLVRAEIDKARAIFDKLVAANPNDAACHVGLANACALQFESTRAALKPDTDALALAAVHAREACRLKPDWAEVWMTLSFVLERTGRRDDALAAARHGVKLEPTNWRHWLRLSYGSWGEERLHAARQVLTYLPGCPLAHCLMATVYIARGALTEARRELEAGLAALGSSSGRFSPVALHWLRGLLLLACGAAEAALPEFENELALEPRGHLYARECAANTWYAIGAHRLFAGDREGAPTAFEEAIARVPRHPMAHAGLAVSSGTPAPSAALESALPHSVDVAIAHAIVLVSKGDHTSAAAIVHAALVAAPPGNAGWLIPVEPMLRVREAPEVWVDVLNELRNRAM